MNLWSSPLSFERSALKYPLIALAMTVAVVTPALADPALANAKKCMGCHNVAVKVVGPSFNDIAKKYPTKTDYLAGKIKSGGSGVWGAIPMPAQTAPDADIKTIANWLAAGAAK